MEEAQTDPHGCGSGLTGNMGCSVIILKKAGHDMFKTCLKLTRIVGLTQTFRNPAKAGSADPTAV